MRRVLLSAFSALVFAGSLALSPTASAQSAPSPDEVNIQDLVIANRILYNQGVVDGFGHVSIRSEKNPNHFYLSRSMAPGLVTRDDILELDLDGNVIDARGRKSYLERFIHAEIYRARPDVKAVVHSHSPAVIPFSVTTAPFKPVSHMGAFLGAGSPVFEIRTIQTDSDMLIRNGDLAKALAKSLGSSTVCLLRGHGDVVVGESLRQAGEGGQGFVVASGVFQRIGLVERGGQVARLALE